jgi:hypothetical protein
MHKELMRELRITNRYATVYQAEPSPDPQKEKSKLISRINTIDTNTFVNRLKKSISDNAIPMHTVLPQNCRYISDTMDGRVITVIEDPPAIRTVRADVDISRAVSQLRSWGVLDSWGYSGIRGGLKQYTFAFPYIVYVLSFGPSNEYHGGSIFFRPLPLTGLGDQLFVAYLYNISNPDNGGMCLGDGVRGAQNTLAQAVSGIINLFWNNAYNQDYSHCIARYMEAQLPYLRNWLEWEHYSKEDPMFIYKAKWLPSRFTLGDVISNTSGSGQTSRITNIMDLAYRIMSTHCSDGIKDESQNDLMSNIANSFMVSSDEIIKVGDDFKMNDKTYRIVDFLAPRFATSKVTHLKAFDEKNDKIEVLKLDSDFKSLILSEMRRQREEAFAVVKGKKYKVGDIVVFRNDSSAPEQYKKIQKIIQFEDQIEFCLGNEYIIPENMQSMKKFIVKNPEYQGIKLKPGMEIFIAQSTGSSSQARNQYIGGLFGYTTIKFSGIDVQSNGELIYQFVNRGGSRVNINPNRETRILLNKDDSIEAPRVFRYMNSLYQIDAYDRYKKDVLFTRKGIMYPSDVTRVSNPNYEMVRKNCLKDDHVSFKSFDCDLRFDVGDRVVVADWSTPTNMLRVHLIIGFKKSDETGNIGIILQDKNGKLSEETIYNLSKDYVAVGKIRKITNAYKKLSAGMKIKAKIGGIANFPKKDTNIIIGFLTDTGLEEPLALCSNCCTLWADDITKNFDIIPMKSPQWKKLEHAPIQLSKIKYQTGDVVEITSGSFSASHNYILCNTEEWTPALKALNIQQFRDRMDYYIVDMYFKSNMRRYGFIEPRMSAAEMRNALKISAIPNMHGAYTQTDNFNVQFMVKDERRLINV